MSSDPQRAIGSVSPRLSTEIGRTRTHAQHEEQLGMSPEVDSTLSGGGSAGGGSGDPASPTYLSFTGFAQCFANAGTSSFAGGELVDGATTVFTLPSVPMADSLLLFMNGQFQVEGVHYTRSSAIITLSWTPGSGEELSCVFATEG